MIFEDLYESMLKTNMLTESVSPVVFHSTSPFRAIEILADDRFIMSNAVNSMAERSLSKKLFYMSTARTKLNNFSYKDTANIVTFRLNGRKLAQTMSSNPIDFFYYEGRPSIAGRNTFEYEDRVLSDKPTIQGFSKYIDEVSVLFNGAMSDEFLYVCKKMQKICASKGIKFGIYKGKSDFLRSTNDMSDWFKTADLHSIVDKHKSRDPESRYRYEKEINDILSFVYLIRVRENKSYKGNVSTTHIREFVKKIQNGNNDSIAWDIKLSLGNSDITSLPEIREQISYIFKYARLSKLPMNQFIKTKLDIIKDML